MQRELSWSHLKALIYIDDLLKCDFYLEICRVERWSVRQLQERANSLLFERTALSKKPKETIRQDHRVLFSFVLRTNPSTNADYGFI